MAKMFNINSFPEKNIVNISKHYILITLCFALILTFVLNSKEDFDGKNSYDISIENFIENIYFGIITIASIGYGDIYPVSKRARIFIAIVAFYSIIAFACI